MKLYIYLLFILWSTDVCLGFCLFATSYRRHTSNPTPFMDRTLKEFYYKSKHDKRKRSMTKLGNSKNSKLDQTEDNKDKPSWAWLLTLVLPLQLVYISNQWSRSSLYYLVNFSEGADPFRSMNVDIGFSEAQYGLLASLAFTTLFAIASLGAGVASDRYNRKVLTVFSAVGWGVATLGTSFSTTYSEVLLWRIAMGLACAFTTPTAYPLITERVPKDRVSLATSLYGTGVAFGGALAALSILLDDQFGWQKSTMIISFVAFGSAALSALLLPNDTKGEKPDGDDATLDIPPNMDTQKQNNPFMENVAEAVSTSRVKWLYLASFLRFCSGLCIGVWSAPYFKMVFPDNAADYAVAQALITAVAGSASGLIGGATADWLSANTEMEDKIGSKLWVPVVGSILAAPTWYFAIHTTESFEFAMTWLALEYLVAECWFGPTISSLLATVGTNVGGTAQGLFTMTGAVANLAPTVLGFLYGQTTGVTVSSSSELVSLLSVAVCFGYISSAFCFAISAQSPAVEKVKEA